MAWSEALTIVRMALARWWGGQTSEAARLQREGEAYEQDFLQAVANHDVDGIDRALDGLRNTRDKLAAIRPTAE